MRYRPRVGDIALVAALVVLALAAANQVTQASSNHARRAADRAVFQGFVASRHTRFTHVTVHLHLHKAYDIACSRLRGATMRRAPALCVDVSRAGARPHEAAAYTSRGHSRRLCTGRSACLRALRSEARPGMA